VDPTQQEAQMSRSSSTILVKKRFLGIFHHQRPVKVFGNSHDNILQVSEIVFSPDHGFAAAYFSFACGSLCGQYETVVFKRFWEEIRIIG
jgi:hypothetical protein